MIFLVEDNEAIRENVRAYLELAGHAVKEFPRVAGVAEALEFQTPRLVILDIMLPDGNGLVLARRLRQSHPELPFIFLTARDSESDRITGLELGADDYVIKPFSPRELALRVEAILRRTAPAAPDAGSSGDRWSLDGHELAVDQAGHSVSQDGRPVPLTAAEWNILELLCRQPGALVTRERILGECLDYLHDGSDRTVNTHIKNLRAKLGAADWIETVRGFGYKFRGRP
jgi:two-component system phosphate regulon response regulator PhoB